MSVSKLQCCTLSQFFCDAACNCTGVMAQASWFSSVCTLLANLLLLKLLPRPIKEKDWAAGKAPLQVTILQGLASCAPRPP